MLPRVKYDFTFRFTERNSTAILTFVAKIWIYCQNDISLLLNLIISDKI